MIISPPNNSRRTPRNASPSSQQNASFILVFGIFVGFMASSFLSMLASCQDYSQSGLDYSSGSIFSLQRFTRTSQATTNTTSVGSTSFRKNDIGWSNVAVYYGNRDHLVNVSDIPYQYYHSSKWFSQVRQDELVYKLLHQKRRGYFVDLAANDAVRISNTYALETQYDWNGLCIEPNAIYWPSLSYRKCQVVGAVVGSSQSQEVQFQFRKAKAERGGIVVADNSRFHANSTTKNRRGRDDATQPRTTISLFEILRRFDAPAIIDYLSLDVEGAELLVLRDFPFDLYRFNLLTIERPNLALSQLLERNGYVLLKKLKRWGETLWAHSDVESQLDRSALLLDTWDYRIRFKESDQHTKKE